MKFLLLLITGICATTQARNFSLSSCTPLGLIKDRDGKVVKGICYPYNAYTYDQGIAACAKIGMDLFYAEDQFVYQSFLEIVKNYFEDSPCGSKWPTTCGLFMNGKLNATDKKWYATINDQQQVMDVLSYKWVQNSGANDPGNCMALKYQNEYGSTPWNCGATYSPICEYNNTYQPPVLCPVKNSGKRYYNLAPCLSIGTILDNCGNVVKGVCKLATSHSYTEAIQACRNIGMDLFVAESPAIYDSFMQYIRGAFGINICGDVWGDTCGLWIGGMRNSTSLYSSVKDWRNVSLDTSFYSFILSTSPGDCIAVKNSNGFKVTNFNCNQALGKYFSQSTSIKA